MKNILIIAALLFSLPAIAQYPASPTTKVDLGRQTTGDGLTFRGAGAPAYTPTSKNNAWVYLDTLTGITHYYYNAAWRTLPNDKTVYPLVKNKSGLTLPAGTVVSVDDTDPATGDKINIVPAEGDGTKPAKLILGVLKQSLAPNAEGYVLWFGRLNGLSLSTLKPVGETWAEGDILYLSGTINGGLTKVIPTKPALDVAIALILRINGNNLTLLVRPTLGEKLGELHDVSIAGATDGQVLTYQGSTGLWIPTTVSGGGGISDGDKGDITVSLSGTVWTIDAGVVDSNKLATNAVATSRIANDAVTSAKIAADAVGTSEIATDAVTALEIATGAVGTDELSNNSVTSIKIGDNQVVESKIFAGAVTETKLGTGAVTETKIGTGAVTETKLGTGAVTTVKIAASAVDSTKIAADAVNTSELVDDAVTAAKIATGAVGADEIATGAVGADEIATGAVGSDEIATGAVGSDEIATGAVNSDELATGSVIEAKIGTGAVTEGKIGTGAVTETKLGTGAVTETKIASDAVTAAKIATGAVGDDELASTAVTPAEYHIGWATINSDGRITNAKADTMTMIVAASDETTNLATLVAARTFRAPYALTIRAVKIDVNTAPTGASILVDLNNGANSVFTTRAEIEANELTSLDATTQPVLNGSFTSVAANAVLTIDIDQIGSTIAGKGLKVTIYYTRI